MTTGSLCLRWKFWHIIACSENRSCVNLLLIKISGALWRAEFPKTSNREASHKSTQATNNEAKEADRMMGGKSCCRITVTHELSAHKSRWWFSIKSIVIEMYHQFDWAGDFPLEVSFRRVCHHRLLGLKSDFKEMDALAVRVILQYRVLVWSRATYFILKLW